jgi:hypothetical protein
LERTLKDKGRIFEKKFPLLKQKDLWPERRRRTYCGPKRRKLARRILGSAQEGEERVKTF